MAPRTMFEKIWDSHVVHEEPGQPSVLYIDLHLIHEVTTPQAFEGLRMAGRKVRRPDLTVATVDHNTPTWDLSLPITDEISKNQLDAMVENTREFGLTLFDRFSPYQGIVHVIGPDLGYTLPGKTVVCGDSHTSTHGALGCFALGIGTSEVEHVLATQTMRQVRPRTMSVEVTGELGPGVMAKDVILAIINEIGVDGGVGHVIEYRGEVIRNLSMEGRMTICNMSIEGGARAGLVAPDDTTYSYLEGRPHAPENWEAALDHWRTLPTDDGASFDTEVELAAAELEPHVSWGTNPAQTVPVSDRVPHPDDYDDPLDRSGCGRALEYMDLAAGTPITDIRLDRVFLGSCTNARIEDLRAAARIVEGRSVAGSVSAMVVPGSGLVKLQAEEEGLDRIFKEAGFEWRDAGCSMCLGMNDDILAPGERCASTSNRNFEGRQGRRGRTHLVSPEMAAAAAVAGHFVDVRTWS